MYYFEIIESIGDVSAKVTFLALNASSPVDAF